MDVHNTKVVGRSSKSKMKAMAKTFNAAIPIENLSDAATLDAACAARNGIA